jgi:hypothetical protein
MRISLKSGTLSATAIAFSAMLAATSAHAQATRTWVDGTGDDANPCSRTAPCKTFPGAMSRTAAGGEINCANGAGGSGGGGGFGALTITKAITINCEAVFSSVLNSGTNGFTINAGANDVVILNGIEINGINGTAFAGTKGINFIAGGTLIVRNCLIYGQAQYGISFSPAAASKLIMINTTVASNGSGSVGGGILIQPTGTGSANVSLSNVRIVNNANNGFRVDTTGNTGAGISVAIQGSQIDGNTFGIAVATPAGTANSSIMLEQSSVSNNTSFGIVTNGATSTMRVGDTTVTGNGTGILAAGSSSIFSYGDNRLDGNPISGAPNNGTFTGAVLPKK